MKRFFGLFVVIASVLSVSASADVIFPGSLSSYTVKLSSGLTQLLVASTKFQSSRNVQIQDANGSTCEATEQVFALGGNQITCRNRNSCFRFKFTPECTVVVTDTKNQTNLCPITSEKSFGNGGF